MIRTAVCDDQEIFAERMGRMVSAYCREHGIAGETARYTDSRTLLCDVEEGQSFDMFLLDIEMPELTGMNLAAELRKHLPESVILFVTSHNKYAIKAFELSVFRYIPKSELETCLPLALDDAFTMLGRKSRDTYLIESSRQMQKIVIDEIQYFYKDRKNTVFVLKDEKVSVRKPLGQVLKELDRPEFLMTERGYVVNLYHVMKLEEDRIYMRGGAVLPVGGSHQKEVRAAVSEFWRRRL